MGAVVAGSGEGGGGISDVGVFIFCGGAGGSSVWVGDMGYVPAHWEDDGQIPPQGSPKVEGVGAEEQDKCGVGLPSTGRGNDRGGITGGGKLRRLTLENGCTIH